MPVLNEELYLADAVAAIIGQNYPGNLRIVLAIGPSSDNTMQVAKDLASRDPQIVVVDNPTGRTPDGLNHAIAATVEEIIVRVDAHCELSAGYIEKAIETLQRTGADNVGGIMGAVGQTPFERAVAAAMTSPLGVGAASFHVGGDEGPAETVYLGVFKRSALERVGGYDTKFTRAQDWEMNFRIRSTGGQVWFNPDLFVTYRPRRNVRALAKQYFEYGSWRREVMRQHPETRKGASALRYFAPPLAVAGSLLGAILGVIGLVTGSHVLTWGFIAPLGYIAITALSSLTLLKQAGDGAKFLPVVLSTMQLSWGTGFLTSKPKS